MRLERRWAATVFRMGQAAAFDRRRAGESGLATRTDYLDRFLDYQEVTTPALGVKE